MNLLIMVQSLSLCLMGNRWLGQVASKIFSNWSLGGLVRVALLPLLPTLSALLGAYDGDTGGCGLATIGGCTSLSQSEGRPDNVLT
jgi:hypothetical protein